LLTSICPISSPAYCQLICLSMLCLLNVHAEISSLFSSLVQCSGLSASHLPFQALFTESSHGDQLLTTPPSLVLWLVGRLLFQALFSESLHVVQLLANHPFSSALSVPFPLCNVSFQFTVYLWCGGSVCLGDYAGLSQG
jgi:hypothetical protein